MRKISFNSGHDYFSEPAVRNTQISELVGMGDGITANIGQGGLSQTVNVTETVSVDNGEINDESEFNLNNYLSDIGDNAYESNMIYEASKYTSGHIKSASPNDSDELISLNKIIVKISSSDMRDKGDVMIGVIKTFNSAAKDYYSKDKNILKSNKHALSSAIKYAEKYIYEEQSSGELEEI